MPREMVSGCLAVVIVINDSDSHIPCQRSAVQAQDFPVYSVNCLLKGNLFRLLYGLSYDFRAEFTDAVPEVLPCNSF